MSQGLTDRGKRYRAQRAVDQRDTRCIYCGRPDARCVDHINGSEDDLAAENLARACQSCNTSKGLLFARLGIGRRTRQFNPRAKAAGADNLAQWVMAVLSIKGHGPLPVKEAVEIIRATPPADRSVYASEIWRRRRARGTDRRPRALRRVEDEIPF